MKFIEMIAGGIGSGKAYIMSEHLKKYKELGNTVVVLTFADPIKYLVEDFYHINKYGELTSTKQNESIENCVDRFYKFIFDKGVYFIKKNSIEEVTKQFKLLEEQADYLNCKDYARYAMQILGTEIGQNVKKTIWAEILTKKLKDIYDTDLFDIVIIDDWRFLFELIYIQSEFCQLYNIPLIPYYVTASKEVRAKRRGITVEELQKISQHNSEKESKEVILPYMNIYYPDNIIDNEGEI